MKKWFRIAPRAFLIVFLSAVFTIPDADAEEGSCYLKANTTVDFEALCMPQREAGSIQPSLTYNS